MKDPSLSRSGSRRGASARNTRQSGAAASAPQLPDELGWDGIRFGDPVPRDDVMMLVDFGLLQDDKAASAFLQAVAPVAPVGGQLPEHAAATLPGGVFARADLAAAEQGMFTQGADFQARATLLGASLRAGPPEQLDPTSEPVCARKARFLYVRRRRAAS